MKNFNYNRLVIRDDIDNIVHERYPDNRCPKCGKAEVYAGSIENKYDNKSDKYVVLSFTVFCKNCGDILGRWDNTSRQYLGVRR